MYYEIGKLLLKVDGMSLSFKNTPILRGIDFEIYDIIEPGSPVPRGQVVAILGLSGRGKTQMFRCIAGLQIPTEGAVYVDGDTEPVQEGEVGVIAQDYPLIETRTVMGNLVRAYQVATKRNKQKYSRTEAESMANRYLTSLNLVGVGNHYPCQLSGGQRQRVAIIQQMMCSKHFLLMDEPFSGLDIIAKDAACGLIREVAAADELNTVIITTHDIRTACCVADRVILLGVERDLDGNIIPGSRIMADYDLKAMDLCWIPEINLTNFDKFVKEIELKFREL